MNRALVTAALLLTRMVGPILAQRPAPGPPNPFQGKPEAVHEGESLYAQKCTGCHGPNGTDGEIGPALVSGDRTDFGATDGQVFNTIKNGIPGTPMGPQKLSDDEIWKIASYIHALRGTALDNPLPGNAAHGEQVFWGKGQCGNCHMLGGKGGLTAPDLNNIAGTRKASTIIDALTKEQHREYGSGGAHLKTLPTMDSYFPVHVTTADGKVIDGILLNQDGYSLQMLGNDQRLRSFDRAKLRRVDIEAKSLMPTDYDKRLTAEEFKDLLAFLTRQGTKPPPPTAGRGGPPRGEER
ncbi:MAG TPA: c-type cytochrome [Bryobacteraceae bacterium]|nr:c-type cytochrome [Bryobacteraceae bacterium]